MIKNKELVTKITEQICKERDHALKYRKQREDKWEKTNDLYQGLKKKSLVSRANIHLPILHGAIETLLSKIDGAPLVYYKPTATADKPKALFLKQSIELDSNLGHWDAIDLYAKKEALMYGRAIEKKFAMRSNGKFKDVRELVLCIDFWIDPMAGGLDPFAKAMYCGQDNIIRTKEQLSNKAIYDQKAVKELISTLETDRSVDSENNSHTQKKLSQRLQRFGHVSGDAMNLSEGVTTLDGKRYYVFFSPTARRAVRVEELVVMNKVDEMPYSSWAAFTDPEEFWSIAPAELFHDINYVQNILVSQLLDNSAQRNYGMKAYDQTKITSPQFLDPKPMGRVPVTGNPNEAIMDITFPSIGENLQLLNWLGLRQDSDTGVTQNTRGVPNSKRMSAAEFNGLIDQVADRIFTHNRLYRLHYDRLCRLYAFGVWGFMTKERQIEVAGAMGVNTVVRSGSELKFSSDFLVEVQLEKEQERDQEKEKQLAFIQRNRQNPSYNQKFFDEKEAEITGFSLDEVRRMTTNLPDSDWRSVAEAHQENEDMLRKEMPPNEAANMSHVQAHLDFVRYSSQLTDEQRKRILEHSDAELQIAERNAGLSVSRLLQAQNAQNMAQQPLPQEMPQGMPQPMMPPQQI